MTTNELLRSYVADRSEAAFAELVRQHIDLVYSAALRQVNGDAPTAQDVTQGVFTDLARKAPRLLHHTALTGWLYTSTRFLAAKARRAELRRHAREQEAHAMNQLLQPAETDRAWQDVWPLLDDVMHELKADDREAVLMRYFERRPLAEIGARLGLSENTARMRVERALDKLRAALAKRGVTSTAVALATALAERAVGAAPAGLAGEVSHAAFVAVAAGGAAGVGLLKFLASTQAKLLVGAGVAALIAGIFVLARLDRSGPATTVGVLSAPEPAAAAAPGESPASDAASAASAPIGSATSNKLVLRIVTADTAKPVPLVDVEWVLLEGTNSSRGRVQATRFGICEVPVPRSTYTQLLLWSKTDGFADTWLHWRSDRGDQIPQDYTLRLARAVQIGGQVVDASGQPVAGAQVGFGSLSSGQAYSEAHPEAHALFGIQAPPTDSAGRWSLSRLTPADLHQMRAAANHREYVRAEVSLADDPAAEKQLLAGTYVFRLGRAVTLSGVVLDPDRQPVPEADVAVLRRFENGKPSGREVRSITNQADGTFLLPGCEPGTNQVTIRAAGFASAKLELQMETNSPPLRVILQRGNVLLLRVVGQAGEPVPNAEVGIADSWTSLRTDAEGRLRWAEAAAEDLALRVSARGYLSTNGVTVKADGQEHVIALAPSLTIAGSVRDADTGRPVTHFRVIPGWARLAPKARATNLQWQAASQVAWTSSAEGKFRQSVAEAVSQDTPLAFRFEADGYAPFVTRVVRADEGVAQFDVALRPAVSVTITALLPDGRPAANADVGTVSPGGLLRVRPGGLARGNTYPSSERIPTTDAQGRFVLPPDDEVTAVIVANGQGYGEASRAALDADPVIRLQPWGRIEGTLLSRGRGAAGRVVQFQYGLDPTMRDAVFADFVAYQATTDSDGRFVFEQVPPGKHRVAQRGAQMSGPRGGMGFLASQVTAEVEVSPGQTSAVTLGNSNYTVRARLRWPAELKRDPGWRIMVSLQRPLAGAPPGLGNDPEALAKWRAQSQTAGAVSSRREPLRLSEENDGNFVADAVPPGSYNLVATIADAPRDGNRPKTLAHARVPVTVPADPPTGTLDVGEILLELMVR